MSSQDPPVPSPDWRSNSTEDQPVDHSFNQPESKPEKKSNPIGTAVKVVVAVVLIGVTIFFGWKQFSQEQALQSGKCVVDTGTGEQVDITEVKCDDTSKDSWKVARVLEGESAKNGCNTDPNVPYIREYSKSSKKSSTPTMTYCLQPNLHIGSCYLETTDDFKMVPCDAKEITFEVLSQAPGEDAKCTEGDNSIGLPGTGVTSCVKEKS